VTESAAAWPVFSALQPLDYSWSWQLTGLRLQQQLLGLALLSQLLGRAVTGQAAADAELHQSGVKAAPAQAAVNVSQKQQQSKKKRKNGLTVQDQSALTLLDLKYVVGWLCSCRLAAEPQLLVDNYRYKAHWAGQF